MINLGSGGNVICILIISFDMVCVEVKGSLGIFWIYFIDLKVKGIYINNIKFIRGVFLLIRIVLVVWNIEYVLFGKFEKMFNDNLGGVGVGVGVV